MEPAANQNEMHMKTPTWTLLTSAVAAAVMAAALSMPALAQTATRDP
jgi:hypothetical protein